MAASSLTLVHFLLTVGKLLGLALCKPKDIDVLKDYHDDYAPVRALATQCTHALRAYAQV